MRSRFVLVVLAAVVLAGCSAGVPGSQSPSTAADSTPTRTPTTPMDPPAPPTDVSNESAIAFATAHEEALLFNRLRNRSDLTAFGVGGATGTVVDARTDAGVYLRLQTAFWYTKETAEGSLHADGVASTAYLVGNGTFVRVPIDSRDIGSFPGPTPNTTADQSIAVLNAADRAVRVNLTLVRRTANGTDPVPVSDVELTAESGAWTSTLLETGHYTVTVAVDGRTITREVVVADGRSAGALVVYVTPAGRLIARYPAGLP